MQLMQGLFEKFIIQTNIPHGTGLADEGVLLCPEAMVRKGLIADLGEGTHQFRYGGQHVLRVVEPGDDRRPHQDVLVGEARDQTLEILDLSGNTFFDSLSRKLMQSLKAGRT